MTIVEPAPSDPAASEARTKIDIRKKAMDYLARREYSVFELSEKLKSVGFDAGIVDEAVETLRLENLVDDNRFCESMTRSRVNKGHGPLRILRDLRNKGVDGAIINSVVDVNDRLWVGRLQHVHERKYGERAPESAQEWAKRARFLASRGFTSDQIRTVLNGRFDADGYE